MQESMAGEELKYSDNLEENGEHREKNKKGN